MNHDDFAAESREDNAHADAMLDNLLADIGDDASKVSTSTPEWNSSQEKFKLLKYLVERLHMHLFWLFALSAGIYFMVLVVAAWCDKPEVIKVMPTWKNIYMVAKEFGIPAATLFFGYIFGKAKN